MSVRKYKINVSDYIEGGAQCKTPTFTWDPTDCAGLVCESEDGSWIKVAIPEGCNETCFWVTYSCDDPCDDDCEPIRYKVCVCSGPEDCPDGCSDCINNVCVSKCEPGEFCNDADVCVECDDTHPCPNGKICVGGKCVCPPDKPYINSKGECVPCTPESCGPGFECTPDGCKPVDCVDGVWHPTKEKCVECINSGHCQGDNECCNVDTNTCECCPGFVRDYETGDCVPAPECEVDDDCSACEFCDDVNCAPITCPDGFVPVPSADGQGCDCKKECDCDTGGCPEGSACVRLDSTTCYCSECEGNCAEGCSEGCYCPNDSEGCIPKPCQDKPCENGDECGPGCGCNKTTKRCEPCASADCGEECDNILGCECTNGVDCEDIESCEDIACDGLGQCPDGCFCNGVRCVPCADLSCETDACADNPECKCTESGCIGDGDGCGDTFTNDKNDCGLIAEVNLEDGCLCPGITAYMIPHIIAKTGTANRYTVTLAARLAKGEGDTWGNVANLNLLDETNEANIADNDTPESGTIAVEIIEHYQPQVWQLNKWVNQGGASSRVVTGGGSFSFAGIARKDDIAFVAYKPDTGKNVISGISRDKILRYEVKTTTNLLKFPNACDYGNDTVPIVNLASEFRNVTNSLDASSNNSFLDNAIYGSSGNFDLGNKFAKWETLLSDSSRRPLFTWYRSKDGSYTADDIIRKIYIGEDSPGRYEDILWGPEDFVPTKEDLESPEGRVFGNMYYKVQNDCSCDERELDFGKVTWCHPQSLELGNIVYSQCNKRMEINSDIGLPCATNQWLAELDLHPDDDTQSFRNAHQAYYWLIVTLKDGTKIEERYVYRRTGVTPGLYKVSTEGVTSQTSIKDFARTFTQTITDVRIQLRYGTSTDVVCEWADAIPTPTEKIPNYIKNCLPNSKISYRFNKNTNNISTLTAAGGDVVDGGSYFDVVGNAGQVITINVTYTDGSCPSELQLSEDCCDTLEVALQIADNNGNSVLTSTVTGGTSPFEVDYYLRNVTDQTDTLVGSSSNPSNNFQLILANPVEGLYFAVVSDVNGCSSNSSVQSVNPRDDEDYILTITPEYNGCQYTGNVWFNFPSEPDIVGGVVSYRVNGGNLETFTITQAMYNAGRHVLSAIGDTVELVNLSVPNSAGPNSDFIQSGSATVPTDLLAEVPRVDTFTANGGSGGQTICEGESVLLEFLGTPFALVQMNSIPNISLDGSGYGSITVNPSQNQSYQITGVTNSDGSCIGSQGVGLTRIVTVVQQPSIEVVSDVCDGTLTFRTVTFNNITSATDQLGNTLTVVGNAVTVDGRSVTSINVVYDNGTCVVNYAHPVSPCNCPTITADLVAPSAICDGDSFTLLVQNVMGGVAPYSYNYYTDSDPNDVYTLNKASRIYSPFATDRYHVRIKDSNDCITEVGNVTVQVNDNPEPNIIAQDGQAGITEVSPNTFEAYDNLTDLIFKTSEGYSVYAWLVIGGYTGVTVGGGSTFTLDVSDFTGSSVQLKVEVEDEAGCIGTETITVELIPFPDIITANEILVSTTLGRLYKVEVGPNPGDLMAPVQLCVGGGSQPVRSIVLNSDGVLYTAGGATLYQFDTLGSCAALSVRNPFPHSNSLGIVAPNLLVSWYAQNTIARYDVLGDVMVDPWYTIADGNSWGSLGDLVRVGAVLYALATKNGGDQYLVSFSLDGSNNVTGFSEVGLLPDQVNQGFGIAHVGGVTYLIYSNGNVYNLNIGTPASSVLIGSITVGGQVIADATNNY